MEHNCPIKCENLLCNKKETNSNKFKVCSSCLRAYYCSAKCQKIDWYIKHSSCCEFYSDYYLSFFLFSEYPLNKEYKYSEVFCFQAVNFFKNNASKLYQPIIFVKLNQINKNIEMSIDKEDIKLIYKTSSIKEKEYIRASINLNMIIIYIYDVNVKKFQIFRSDDIYINENDFLGKIQTKLIFY